MTKWNYEDAVDLGKSEVSHALKDLVPAVDALVSVFEKHVKNLSTEDSVVYLKAAAQLKTARSKIQPRHLAGYVSQYKCDWCKDTGTDPHDWSRCSHNSATPENKKLLDEALKKARP